MGKSIIIKGADFSNVSVNQVINLSNYTEISGAFALSNGRVAYDRNITTAKFYKVPKADYESSDSIIIDANSIQKAQIVFMKSDDFEDNTAYWMDDYIAGTADESIKAINVNESGLFAIPENTAYMYIRKTDASNLSCTPVRTMVY